MQAEDLFPPKAEQFFTKNTQAQEGKAVPQILLLHPTGSAPTLAEMPDLLKQTQQSQPRRLGGRLAM
jgi:hypothetical protein